MPSLSISLRAKTRFEEVPVSGDNCFACKELILLTQFNLIIEAYAGKIPVSTLPHKPLCRSCKEQLESGMKEKQEQPYGR